VPSLRPTKGITDRWKQRSPQPVKFSALSRESRKLFELVPQGGVFIGNAALQRKSALGKHYWKVRNQLLEAGFLTLGKGRGGSVARSAAKAEGAAKKEKLFVHKESELYEPLRHWLEEEWGKDVKAPDFFDVRVTGTARNRQRASGQWSRPDVTLVEVNSYEYLAQPVLDVTTFEVKKFSDAEDILSVFEAAAHSRWAHFSYLVVEVPNGDYEFIERLISELERFNIGLIFMWFEKGRWQFEEQEWETDRLSPEPEQLDALLKTFFKDGKRELEFKSAVGKA
jgi:hypothetical protein